STLITLGASNHWSAYPMIYATLYDDTAGADYKAQLDTLNAWSEMMLDEAPPQGPYTLYPDSNAHGYAVNNRFIRGRSSHYIGHLFTEGSQFNGLDYMMLHNLYYLLSPSKWELLPPVGIKEATNKPFQLYTEPGAGIIILRSSELLEK